MSIAALNQVYDEVRRLTIAGSDLAANDFRLKKLVPPLRKSAAKAPVFGKVADSVETLLGCTPKTSAQSLLDLGSLVTAILYTQGQTGAAGKLKPLETTNLGLTISATSARVLKPLIEALTTTGSGRLEIVTNAHQRGGFKDLRLIKHAVNAIDDPYPELGDYVCDHVLPIYGKAIYPELRASFDPKGKGGHARRLRLMHKLDAEASHDLVTEVLEGGSKEVKLAAIGCLEGRADAVDFLLEQARSRTKDVRAAAFRSLSSIDTPEVVELLVEALADPHNVELVAPHVTGNKNKKLRAFVVDEVGRLLDAVLDPKTPKAAKTTTKKKASKKKAPTKKDQRARDVHRLHELLAALIGRKDKPAEKLLLRAFAANETIAPLEGTHYIDGGDVVSRVAQAMVMASSKAALKALADAGPEVAPNLVAHTFVAYCVSTSAKAAYDAFAPHYVDPMTGRTKVAKLAQSKADHLRSTLNDVIRAKKASDDQQWWWWGTDDALVPLYKTIDLDPRWLDAAITRDDTSLVIELASLPGASPTRAKKRHPKLDAFFAAKVEVELKKKTWSPGYDLDDILRAMITSQHPKTVPLFLEVMKRACTGKRSYWGTYYLVNVIPDLPPKAIAPLEALIPSISENLLDTYVDQLDDLRRKHAS
jgi:HEAT repeats